MGWTLQQGTPPHSPLCPCSEHSPHTRCRLSTVLPCTRHCLHRTVPGTWAPWPPRRKAVSPDPPCVLASPQLQQPQGSPRWSQRPRCTRPQRGAHGEPCQVTALPEGPGCGKHSRQRPQWQETLLGGLWPGPSLDTRVPAGTQQALLPEPSNAPGTTQGPKGLALPRTRLSEGPGAASQ